MALGKNERSLVQRGYALTASSEAIENQETEAALQNEQFRYEREVLDLQSKFAYERDALRRAHLQRAAAICDGSEQIAAE
jgi:hypothetical protein